MGTINAPFSKEQVDNINYNQLNAPTHPFTCCSHNGCNRSKQEKNGLLIATTEGLICPCGEWKQKWVYENMANTIIKQDWNL